VDHGAQPRFPVLPCPHHRPGESTLKARKSGNPRTLVTFLGRARQGGDAGYQRASYRFDDGTVRETPFFGLALNEHTRPDRGVVLGTPGSMWDVLIEHMAQQWGNRYEDQRLFLDEAARSLSVGAEHLEALRPLAEESLGVPCELHLIDYGEDLKGQMRLLEVLRAAVGGSGQVQFDITHGLRHLSVLSLLACRFLEAMSTSLSVEQIWYGAFEMRRDGEVPVLKLEGLSRLERWVGALERFDNDGDYGVFTALLISEGMPREQAELLRKASFFERALNLPGSKQRLKTFLGILEDSGLPGAGALFTEQLRKRIDWARGSNLYEHQRRLAFLHLRKGDYLRAAILANEAVLTRWISEHGGGGRQRIPDPREGPAGTTGGNARER